VCASHILENVMEEITAANPGSSSRQKKALPDRCDIDQQPTSKEKQTNY
jgi:hypothetical protein